MRLGTCVAIELSVLALSVSAASAAAAWGMGGVRDGASALSPALTAPVLSTMAVATGVGTRASALLPVPEPILAEPEPEPVPPIAVSPYAGEFNGQPDEELLGPLRDGSPVSVRMNRGGSSISLRIKFDNGARAAFKPNQTNLQTIPRKEVAAYRINRLLGLSSVQPAIGRKFRPSELWSVLDSRSRPLMPRIRAEVVVEDDGFVHGEVSWWIPVIRRGKVNGHTIDSTSGIVTWKRYLAIGGVIPDKSRVLVEQISDLLLFDFVINNPDRWSGGNARISKNGETLYFMDNTLSFGANPKANRKVRLYLRRTQKFSRGLVGALRNLDRSVVESAMAEDNEPFGTLLTDAELDAMWKRRARALEYIDGLIETHGEDAVLEFE